jgi:HEAT repeat protein
MSVLDELFSGDDERAQAAASQVTADDLPALRAALAEEDPDRRWWAVAALAAGSIPNEHATELLTDALRDADVDVRAAAVHSLGGRAASEAVAPLMRALADPSDYVDRLAADALIHIGRPAVPELIDALMHDPHPRVRAGAARALAYSGDPAAIPALFGALEDDSLLVQHWVDEGLDKLGVGQVYFSA